MPCRAVPGRQPGCVHRGSRACRIGTKPGRVLLRLGGGEDTRTGSGREGGAAERLVHWKGLKWQRFMNIYRQTSGGLHQRSAAGGVGPSRSLLLGANGTLGTEHKPAVGLRNQEPRQQRPPACGRRRRGSGTLRGKGGDRSALAGREVRSQLMRRSAAGAPGRELEF